MSRSSSLLSLKPGMTQRHDLEPEAHRMKPLNRIEDIVEKSAEFAVVAILKTLQIDFVKIDPGLDVVQHFRRAIAVGNVRCFQPGAPRALENFDGPFARDQRLVVGAGDDPRALFDGQCDELFRRELMRWSDGIDGSRSACEVTQFWQ